MHRLFATACVAVAIAAATPARAQTTGSLDDLTGEDQHALQVTGFGTADYTVDGRTGDNRFDAGKLAVGLFRELNDRVWIFGQLTTSVSAGEAAGDEASTEIEIDNLIVNLTPAASDFSVSIGKFDTPLGFERDDEPLNLLATTSNNFELARPVKMVGAIGRWAVGRRVDIAGWVANGWQSDLEPNHGKTVGGRVGFRPSERATMGAGFLYGPEGEPGDEQGRYLVSLDYGFQPTSDWVIGGEANVGGDRQTDTADGASWYGATAIVFKRFTSAFGTAGRVEAFNDRDGARTGVPQTITSFSIAPVYFVGTGGEGIFANIEHTTLRIPRFQLRGEARWDRSTEDVFETANGDTDWTMQFIAQLVATF